MRQMGALLIIGGVVAIVAGLALRSGLFSWFGNLPGDIRHSGARTSVFIPITSMVLLSVTLTIVVNLVGRYFRG